MKKINFFIFMIFILFFQCKCEYNINSIINCSSIDTEFNCEFCNEKDTYCHCIWKNKKCEIDEIKLNEKKWILDFNNKYKEQNKTEMKKYCGELPKIIKENTILIPNLINEKYGKLNETIYCKYKTKVDIKISYFRITKIVFIEYPIKDYQPEIFLKVNTKEIPIRILNFTNFKYYGGFYNNTYYEFYIKLDNQFENIPYKINLNFYSYEQIRFFISILTFVITFIVIFFIICLVNYCERIKRKKILNLLNNKQIYNSNFEKYGNHCSICLGIINNNTEISLTPCNHIFHYLCFYSWINNKLNNRNTKCPLCNNSLLKKSKLNNNLILNENTTENINSVNIVQ